MKKAVFFGLLMILVITISQFIVEAEDTYYYADIDALIEAKGCKPCHRFDDDMVATYDGMMAKELDWGGPVKFVAPGDPDNSMLIWRIEGKTVTGQSLTRMPGDGNYFSDADIAIFRAWISQGALEDIVTGVDDTKSWMEIKSKFK